METENIILEHLRAIRADIALLRVDMKEIKGELASMRHRGHARDGDLVRHTDAISELRADVERIKRRLDLVDDAG